MSVCLSVYVCLCLCYIYIYVCVCVCVCVCVLLTLMKAIWREGEVFQDWRDAVIIPVPKKGNLQSCDNWRGISLLDVVGKVLGRIIQDRLQVIVEVLLADSQCGFWKG